MTRRGRNNNAYLYRFPLELQLKYSNLSKHWDVRIALHTAASQLDNTQSISDATFSISSINQITAPYLKPPSFSTLSK